MSTTGRGISRSTRGVVGFVPPIVAESIVSLCPCGTHSTAIGSGDYLRPEDNPFHSEIEGAEDSLQFHTKTDLSTANPTHDILLPSPDTAVASVVEEGGIAQLRGQAEVENSGDEEGSDDEEESEEVKGDDEEVKADDEEEQDDEEVGDDEEEGDDKEGGQKKVVGGRDVRSKIAEDQDRNTERLDYGSGPNEGSPPALHTRSRSRMQSQVQTVDYANSGSDKV